ncbi:MAG: beta-galactosidase [Anaerolineales bacterium]|nr:MAG: beta-galactosidase [Anaerolineales bacterium]
MSETVAYPKDVTGLRPLELHYFRVPRERWELMLTRLRQMGADAVGTVAPWFWHEPQDGLFDLTGITHPTRDVPGFLETCQAMGFPVVLAASPCVGAGLLGGGVPGWLLRDHPEICALDPASQPRRYPATGDPLPSPEHPTYVQHVERWYRKLADTLVTWQWPDGPIVALQVFPLSRDDLEPRPDQIPAGWDYNPHVVRVQWTVWLRQQYEGIQALNAAWKTDYGSFNDADFPNRPASLEPSPRLDDAVHFVAYAANHALETYARMLRETGWTVPILTDPNVSPPALKHHTRVDWSHAVQVDPEPPQIGAGVRWAMDAPLRGDGYPQHQFWAVKAALLDMEDGLKQIEGAVLVRGAESRRVRLPRPTGDYGVYRLLLDGGLLDVSSRKRGETLHLDYVAADETGQTDMVITLNDRSVPFPGFLQEYLASLLMGKASALQQAGSMCQALAEAFSGPTPPVGQQRAWPSLEDLQAAERSLAEAQRAARRAAASLGRLERLASEVRGDLIPDAPTLPDPSAFSSHELEHLTQVRDACAQAAPILREAAASITTLAQTDQPGGEELTVFTYRAAFEGARTAAREVEGLLAQALGRLRADLAAGTLSLVAWPLQDWLTRILQQILW